MKKRTKWTVAGAIGLAIVIIGVTSAMKGRNKATEVRIEKVQKRDLVASVTASGQVQPHTKVDISADISGRIVRLAVKEGQMVTYAHHQRLNGPRNYVEGRRYRRVENQDRRLDGRTARCVPGHDVHWARVGNLQQLGEGRQHWRNRRIDRPGDRLRSHHPVVERA